LEKHGHIVLRNAPYHCEFNAIEHVWAHVKREFDLLIQQVKTSHTVEVVIETWNKALLTVTPEIWANNVRHTVTKMKEVFEKEGLSTARTASIIIPLGDQDDSDFDDEEDDEQARLLAVSLRKEQLLGKVRKLFILFIFVSLANIYF
jgi:hypothetical protein